MNEESGKHQNPLDEYKKQLEDAIESADAADKNSKAEAERLRRKFKEEFGEDP